MASLRFPHGGPFLEIHFKISCWFPTLGASWVKSEIGPKCGGQGRLEADPSRVVGGRYNNQRNLHMKLVLGGYKMWRPQRLPSKIFKVCVEAFTEFSHICQPRQSKHLHSLKAQSLKWPQLRELWVEGIFPRTEEVVRSLWLPRSSSLTNQQSHPPDNLLQLPVQPSHILNATALTNKLKIVQRHKHNRSFLAIIYTELANRKAETQVARSSVHMYILLKERRERGGRRVRGGLSGPCLEVMHILLLSFYSEEFRHMVNLHSREKLWLGSHLQPVTLSYGMGSTHICVSLVFSRQKVSTKGMIPTHVCLSPGSSVSTGW